MNLVDLVKALEAQGWDNLSGREQLIASIAYDIGHRQCARDLLAFADELRGAR